MSITLSGVEKTKEVEKVEEQGSSRKKNSSPGLFAVADSICSAEGACAAKASKKKKLEEALTPRQKEVFLEIFKKLAETSFVNLIFIKGELEELSKEVEEVPPLDFLRFLRSEKTLQDHIKILKTSSESTFYFVRGVFPYDRTIQDFSSKIEKEKHGEELKKFLETLSKEMQEKVAPMIQENRFKDFFELFLEN